MSPKKKYYTNELTMGKYEEYLNGLKILTKERYIFNGRLKKCLYSRFKYGTALRNYDKMRFLEMFNKWREDRETKD